MYMCAGCVVDGNGSRIVWEGAALPVLVPLCQRMCLGNRILYTCTHVQCHHAYVYVSARVLISVGLFCAVMCTRVRHVACDV